MADNPAMPVADAVASDIISRAKFGKRKYGVSLDESPDDIAERLQHLYEELLDGACYIKSLQRQYEGTIDVEANRKRFLRGAWRSNVWFAAMLIVIVLGAVVIGSVVLAWMGVV